MAKRPSSLGAAFKAIRLVFTKHRDAPDKPRKPIPARTPTPQDATRPSIINLSEDIILHIFEVVADTCPKSLSSLALVCSSFNYHACQVRFRNVTVNLDMPWTDSLLESLAADDSLLSSIRTLQVLTNGKCPESSSSHLSQLIVRMNGLRDLHWQGIKVPETMLKGLAESNPRVKLHAIVLDPLGRSQHARQLLASLADSPLLFSLHITASYKNAAQCLEITQPLKRILLSCPNIRRLLIDLHLPRDDGCVRFGPPEEYPGLGLTGGERPPPLEELTIHDYPWGHESHESPFHSKGYPKEVPETEYWAETFDWSRLRYLELTDRRFNDTIMLLDRLHPKLRCLEHMSLGNSPWYSPTLSGQRDFLEQVPSALQSIHMPSLNCAGIAAITRHASTLRRLVIHQEGFSNKEWEDDVMSDADLAELRDKLVNLQELAMDIGRDGGDTWPSAKVDIIASFPCLQHLTLWFSHGDGSNHPPEPWVMQASVAKMFSDLRQRSLTKSLRRLKVYYTRPRPDLRGLWSFWAQNNWMSFVCELDERGDEAARGAVRSHLSEPEQGID